MKYIILILILILSFVSCKKEDSTPKVYYEFSISNTTISEAMAAIQNNVPLIPDFKVNSNGEGVYNSSKFNLTDEELQELTQLVKTLSTQSLNITYGIDRYTPSTTSIHEIKYWYKDIEVRTWINRSTEIPAELQNIWNWYLSIQNTI